ncbi:hypothetical protein [Nocardia gipuzkoensis]|uniref:hypothetical protein n=1 Tax=Nocardia gipuzkoensis TaxID=2749991 RepID=UPI00237DD992|nr:hypothetical protein [Nocardia gipuzkoensis]MDE1675106.1 hypothetical protein [Nocardia gipuzkoensis]
MWKIAEREVIASRSLGTVMGFDVIVYLHPDDLPGPDGDCYSSEDIEAFGSTWSYVVVAVSVGREGLELGRAEIGRCEYGTLGDGSECDPLADGPGFIVDGIPEQPTFAFGYGTDLLAEAITDARDLLARLSAAG